MLLEYIKPALIAIDKTDKHGGEILSFSKALSDLMADRHITNYRLAKDIGVHQSTVKNWLDGKKPSLMHAYKICDYFGVSMDELVAERSG